MNLAAERDFAARVTGRRHRLLEIVSDLVRRPSENQAPHGSEAPCQHYAAEHLRRCAAEPLLYEPDRIPGILEHPMYWPGRHYAGRPNPAARIPGAGGAVRSSCPATSLPYPRERSPEPVIRSARRSRAIASTGVARMI